MSATEALPCKVCGAASPLAALRPGLQYKVDYRIHTCPACSFSWIANCATDYAALYSEEYYRGRSPADPSIDYMLELAEPRRTVRVHEWDAIVAAVAALEPRWQSKRWLDYACGNGGLVRHLRENGCPSSWGWEQGWIAEQAKSAGIPLLPESDLAPGSYDVVTLIEVVEHLEDPVATLRAVRALLKPGGLLFLTTGNAEPFLDSLDSWMYVIPDVHIALFTPDSLAKALLAAGFRPGANPDAAAFTGLYRYRILKTLRARRRAWWQNWVPWGLVGRLADARYQLSRLPFGRAV